MTCKIEANFIANQEEIAKLIIQLQNTKLEDKLIREGGVILQF
jgi:hypothetical protein